MPCIRRNGNEGENFGVEFPVRRSDDSHPRFDGGSSLLVNSIGRIDVDSGVIPALAKSVMFGKAVFRFGMDDGVLIGAWIEVDASAKALANGIDVLRRRSPFLANSVDLSARGHECISSHFLRFNVSSSSRRTASRFPAGAMMLNQPSIAFLLVEKYDWSAVSAAKAILTFVN